MIGALTMNCSDEAPTRRTSGGVMSAIPRTLEDAILDTWAAVERALWAGELDTALDLNSQVNELLRKERQRRALNEKAQA